MTVGREWPVWPRLGVHGRTLLDEVAGSGVWTISGRSRGGRLQAERFREEFAHFTGRAWCVETDHGTSALTCSFQALDIGPGDEVIVPALTWVACATSVLQVGARPVLIDVDPRSLCLTAEGVEAAITDRTRAILVVHLHCTAADMPPINAVAEKHGLHIVEDTAQAHGGRWTDGRLLGSDGILATYSMQHSKTLTAGEGGSVTGDDEGLRRRVEALRADSRELRRDSVPAGEMHLDETAPICGTNSCLSEFAAAILRDGLRRLPEEVEHRAASADRLDELLTERGVRVIERNPDLAVRPVYEYGIYLDPTVFGDRSPAELRQALSVELGLPVYEADAPLHVSPLFAPETNRRFPYAREECLLPGEAYEVSTDAWQRLAMIHHAAFLAEPEAMELIANACAKLIPSRV